MALQGSKELRARLRAIKTAFKPLGRDWADETARLARPMVPVATGRLKKSIRRRNASQKKATVVAHYTAYFVDKGPKPHTIKAKRARTLVSPIGGRTIFSRQVHHRGYRGRPFRERAAREALRRNPKVEYVVQAWNKAAR